MKKIIITILFSLFVCVLNATTINIPTDYSTIQAGINAATNGDTVLVQIGTYIENINFNGKNITVASQYLTTQDTSYISQTVIDGNSSGSVVTFESGEDSTAIIIGFTLNNGRSRKGGGIECSSSSPSLENVTITSNSASWEGGGMYCYSSSPSLENVTITGNSASTYGAGMYCSSSSPSLENVTITGNSAGWDGGGIYCEHSFPSLENVTITSNNASYSGGGIYCSSSSPSFNATNRCNIYSNTIENMRGFGVDIYTTYNFGIIDVIVDTFTVMTPTDYYATPIDGYTFDILNSINGNLINSDVYVSVNGDDYNTGTSADEPFRTINHALSMIYSDSANINTIHIEPGIYSETTNGEMFPINWSNYVNLSGSNQEYTILDANNMSGVMEFNYITHAIIENITITNGQGSGSYPNFTGGGITFIDSSPSLENVTITGNSAGWGGGGIYCYVNSSPSLENVTITCNSASSYGGGIYCYVNSSPSLENVTITGNSASNGGGIYCYNNSSPSLENVTITGNSASSYGGGGIYTNDDISVINCIISDNSGNYGIYVSSGNPDITYSDFYNNENGNFYNCGQWIGVNVTTNANGDSCDAYYNIQLDPLFVDSLNGDYHLSWANYPIPDSTKSPCIDAGDPTSPLDPDGTIADMGEYYFYRIPYVQNPMNTIEMYCNTTVVIDMNDIFIGGDLPLNYSVSVNEHINVDFNGAQATINPEVDWFGTEWLHFKLTDNVGNTAIDTVKVNVIRMDEYTYNYNASGIPSNWEIIHNGTTTFPWQKIYDPLRTRADSSMIVKNEGMFKTADELLLTQEYDFSLSDSIFISFWEDFKANGSSEGVFGYSVDGGYSWIPLYTISSDTIGILSLDLNSLSGESSVKFRWRYSSTLSMGDNWWNIDDVYLEYNYVSFSVPQVTNFAIADYGTDYISLSWDTLSIDYFSCYEIYYDTTATVDTTSNKWSFVMDSTLNEIGCGTTTISGLPENHYYFTICAKDGFGHISDYSDIIDIGIGDPPIIYNPIPPNQPCPALDSSRTVTIGAKIYDTHSNIDLSSIQYRFDANGNGYYNENWNDYVLRNKSRQDTIDVSVDVTYTTDGDDLHFEWRAKDSVSVLYGFSGLNNEEGISDDYIVRIDSEAPETINDFVCSDTTINTIDLEWNATTDAHFQQYEIYYSNSDSITLNDSCWSAINDTSLYNIQTTSTTIYGIDNSTDKYFAICAIDSVGNRSEFSDVILNVPITYPPYCESPYPGNQPEPTWSTSRTVEIGITFYDYYGIDSTTVQYRYDKDGNGFYGTGDEWQDVYSRSGEIILLSGNKKNAITENKKVINKTNESIILSHDRNTEKQVIKEVQNAVLKSITHPEVKLLDKLRISAVDTVVARINALYNVDGDSLHFEFRAKDVNGYGYTYSGFNNEEGIGDDYVVRIDATLPDSITMAQSGYPTDSTLTVAWSTSNDEFFDSYQVYYATHQNVTEADSLWDKGNDPSLSNSLQYYTTITGLAPVTNYYFKVRAIDLAGNKGGFSPECHSTTTGVYPPASPENLFITIDKDSMDVIISWDAVTQDTGGNPIVINSYRIYNSSTPGFEASSNYLLDTISDTTYTHENVLQLEKMFYKVTAQTAGELVKSLLEEEKRNEVKKLIDMLINKKGSKKEQQILK